MWIALVIVAGFIAADFFVGMYHMLTDKGWNIRQQVKAFREHHDGAVVFDLKPVFIALPVVAVGVYFRLPFVAAFAFFAGISELIHYAAHRPQAYPRFVHWLQRAALVLSPDAHARHHKGKFDRSYCIVSGWTNWLVDHIARFIPQRKSPSSRPKKLRQPLRYRGSTRFRRFPRSRIVTRPKVRQ